MTIEEILAQEFAAIKKQLTAKATPKVTVENCLKQYDPLQHTVMNEEKRPKKLVKKVTGNDANDKPIYTDVQEEVARIAIPMQQTIVGRAVGFLLGNPVEISVAESEDNEQEKTLLAMVKKVWRKSKLDFRNSEIAEIMFSECEVAELWYLVDAEEGYWGLESKAKFKPKMKILSESKGDKLYPFFDDKGDMVAFSREYTIEANGKKEAHFDIYTADRTIKYTTVDGNTGAPEIIPNLFKKIPIVYYKQDVPEWYKVQQMIERLETSVSNRADSNDYSGAPITIVKGKVLGFASKGEQGKVLQVDGEGDVKYLESTNAPESVKLEWETLREFILSMTQTPDISFSQMKGLGQLSGIALKLMFLDAHLKARKKEATFGEGIQRRLNLLMSMIGNVIDTGLSKAVLSLELEPVFTPYLPVNEKEDIDTLTTAVTGGVLSKTTAVALNPLVSDPEAELELISADSQENLGGNFGA